MLVLCSNPRVNLLGVNTLALLHLSVRINNKQEHITAPNENTRAPQGQSGGGYGQGRDWWVMEEVHPNGGTQ